MTVRIYVEVNDDSTLVEAEWRSRRQCWAGRTR